MNNASLQIKVQQRLNKLASVDYDNVACWQVVEAYNKAQIEWCRRQLVGTNILRQGDEQSKRRVDDLQHLLKDSPLLNLSTAPLYEETAELPGDYLAFKRMEVFATNSCCKDPRLMTVYLGEEANTTNYLKDENKKPSFEWGETFVTLIADKIRIYTGGDFKVATSKLVYYKKPRNIQIKDCTNLETELPSIVEVTSELKDDIVEIIIDEAVVILAGDIESQNQTTREKQAAEGNN